MTLAIRSLQTHWRGTQPLPAQRLQGWVDTLAAQDGDALAAGLVREDEWLFVRRLPLQLRWRADAADEEIAGAWRDSLAAALQQAAGAPGGPEVLRYAHRHDALADLLYRSALGETGRQWAWQRMALLPRAGLAAAQALEHATGVLLREPQAVWPVLARLLAGETDCACLTALLRAWSAARWRELLLASPQTRPYAWSLAPGTEAEAEAGTAPAPAPSPSAATPSPAAAAGLTWAAARPQLVADRAGAVAVLLAALTWPGGPPTAAQAALRLRAVQQWLQPPAQRAAPVAHRDSPGTVPPGRPANDGAAPVRERDEQQAALPPLPPMAAAGLATQFGGLLFWLGQLPRLGAVAKGESPSALALWALARALGVPADDPACAAFCGGGVPDEDLPPALVADAQAHAQRFAAWLDEAAPDLAPPRIEAVCRRTGRLHMAPGWIELRLPLASVDTAVRRLGLDLDPGWLPWLGCVVSIRYED